jgi:F-type H+-transporting ATPase subunit b
LSRICIGRRSLALVFRFSLLLAIAAAFAAAPARTVAQQAGPAAASSPAAATPQAGSTTTPAGDAAQPAGQASDQSNEDQEQGFLHSPAVQALARMLHLGENTTIIILLGINFAIIVLCIAIPLGRVVPKVFRNRSQIVRQDLEAARKATAEAQARMSAVEAKLAGLGEEIEKFRVQIEQETVEDEKRIKAALAEESARIVTAAEQEIGMAVAQARRGLRDFAADLAIEQAAKQVKLTPETDRALIAEFVAGVAGDSKGGKN